MAGFVNLGSPAVISDATYHESLHIVKKLTLILYMQGDGTPIDSLLQAATVIKLLTNTIFIITLH